MQLSDELRTELTALIKEFQTHYGPTEKGEKHLAAYRQNREEAIANFPEPSGSQEARSGDHQHDAAEALTPRRHREE